MPESALPIVSFKNQAAWTRWLEKNHADSAGVWLRIAKPPSPAQSISYAEALRIALCYGWIDGQKRSEGCGSWLQKFTRRGKRSIWSKVNCGKSEQLIAAGMMKAAGLEEVERAKSDGRWLAAYDSPRTALVPEDLQAALAASPRAEAFFRTLDSQNRYAILFRIQTAKKPETKARRIQKFIAMLEEEKKVHP